MTKESAQSKRMKQHIQTIFLQLISQQGFDKLTVVTIVDAAAINRGTFYRYYQDKYQLLEDIENHILENYLAIIGQKLEADETIMLEQKEINLPHYFYTEIIIFTQFFFENREILKVLLSENGDYQFIKKFEQAYIDMARQKITYMLGGKKLPYYETLFFVSGIISVIEDWILTDGQETPEEIATILSNTFFKAPLELLGLRKITTTI